PAVQVPSSAPPTVTKPLADKLALGFQAAPIARWVYWQPAAPAQLPSERNLLTRPHKPSTPLPCMSPANCGANPISPKPWSATIGSIQPAPRLFPAVKPHHCPI